MAGTTIQTSSERAKAMCQSILNGTKKQHIIVSDAPNYESIIDLNLNSYCNWLNTKNAKTILMI